MSRRKTSVQYFMKIRHFLHKSLELTNTCTLCYHKPYSFIKKKELRQTVKSSTNYLIPCTCWHEEGTFFCCVSNLRCGLPTVSKPPKYYTSLLFKISAFSVELLNESSPHGELTSTPGFFWFSLSASPTANSLSVYRALCIHRRTSLSLSRIWCRIKRRDEKLHHFS